VIREARATIVLATQAYTSLLGSRNKRYAVVLMLTWSNELILACANYDSAVIASKNIGERISIQCEETGLFPHCKSLTLPSQGCFQLCSVRGALY
jgi:hypothetical protein